MTAIAPPPVGTEAEPAVQLDNARALKSLRGSGQEMTEGTAASRRKSMGLLIGIGAATLLAGVLGGAIFSQRRSRYRQLNKARLSRTGRLLAGQLAAILAKNKGVFAGLLARR